MGISYKVVVRLGLTRGKMYEGRSGGHAESGSVGSSRESTWRERRHKRREDRERKREEEQSGLGEGLYQTHRTISGASGHGQLDKRDQELERLCRLVRDLEFEAKGRRQRRDRDNQENRDGSEGNQCGEGSNQFGSRPGTIPIRKNYVNVGTIPVHKNHINARIVPIPKNHVDAGIVPILDSHIDSGTVHIHTNMLIGVRIPQRSDGPTTLLWML